MMIAEISPPVAVPGPAVGAGNAVGPGFAAALSAALPVARADAATMPAVVPTMPADTTVPPVSPDPGVDTPAAEGADPEAAPLMPPAVRKMPERPLIPRVAGATAIAPPAEASMVREPEPLRSEQVLGRRSAVARRAVPAVQLLPEPSPSAYSLPSPPIVVPLMATAGPHNSLTPTSLPIPPVAAALPITPVAAALPPTVGPTVGIPVSLSSFELDLPPTIGPTVGIPAPLPSLEWPLPPTIGPTVGTSAHLPATPVSQGPVIVAMAPPVAPAPRTQAPIASRGTDVPAEAPTGAAAAAGAVPAAVPAFPTASGGRPAVRDGAARDRADPLGHAAASPRLPDASQLSVVPLPGFVPPPAAAPPPPGNAAPPGAPADAARAADAGALTVTTPALGDVRIALDGGPQDLRVSLALGAGGAMLVNADAARLGTDLAAQGLRLQSLDVGGGGGGGGAADSNPGSGGGETRRPVPPRLFVAQPSDRFATPDRYA
ncbi:hypothetical protein [Sandarakinorhabdus sp. DWP1-3-1]|uniref:hypothetical protein n=1 Tax=Sandarakinorhabdus sp. DWP1-3-1 TaxID=2804627 RepID=UPI003CE80F7D